MKQEAGSRKAVEVEVCDPGFGIIFDVTHLIQRLLLYYSTLASY